MEFRLYYFVEFSSESYRSKGSILRLMIVIFESPARFFKPAWRSRQLVCAYVFILRSIPTRSTTIASP